MGFNEYMDVPVREAHNCRARRIQNMGYTPDNSLWLSLRGGDVYFNNGGTSDQFDQAKLGSRGFGILDVG